MVKKRLNIAFRKHTAAGSNGIGPLRLRGKSVPLSDRNIQKRSHLVDKGTGSACAGSVPSDFHAIREKENLGIFSAKFDDTVGFRIEKLCGLSCRIDFLVEGERAALGNAHTGRTGKGKMDFFPSLQRPFFPFLKNFAKFFTDT